MIVLRRDYLDPDAFYLESRDENGVDVRSFLHVSNLRRLFGLSPTTNSSPLKPGQAREVELHLTYKGYL